MILQAEELKKRMNSQSQFSTHRKKVDDATKHSQFEIQCLKAQKVRVNLVFLHLDLAEH